MGDSVHVNYEEALARYGECSNHVRGTSMEPLLLDMRSIVHLIPAAGHAVMPGDVVLYRGLQPDSYILHRVLRRKENWFLIRGDNTDAIERIPTEAILGIMDGYCRKPGSAYRTAKSFPSRCYIRLLPLLRLPPVRLARRVWRKIFSYR